MERTIALDGTYQPSRLGLILDSLPTGHGMDYSTLTVHPIGPALEPAACRSQSTTAGTEKATSSEPQGFEWIPHGDVSARKRARAHVTRGFRRQKAAQAQLLSPNNAGSSSSSSESGKTPNRGSCVSSQGSARATAVEGGKAAQPRNGEEVDVDVNAKSLRREIVLQRTTGSDPFAAFPVKLSRVEQELLDHFFFGLAPLSFVGDNRADFQPVKKLVFNMSLLGAPGFHAILSIAANDIAAAKGIRMSEDGLNHQRIAIALMNKKLSSWKQDSSNEGLASVALLAGLELMFGTPHNFNTHMDGLAAMLKLRGGIYSIQTKDPQVYSIISWFDYAGSCNLVSRRRFQPVTPAPTALSSNSTGVPPRILTSLPSSYDLHHELLTTFSRLHTMTLTMHSRTNSSSHPETTDNVNSADALLYESICIPDTEFNRSRRRHLLESLCLLTLIYAAVISEYEGDLTEIFLFRFAKIWNVSEADEVPINVEMGRKIAGWGEHVIVIFRALLKGEGYEEEGFMQKVLGLVDVCTGLDWAAWRRVKDVLMGFLMWDVACEGEMQDRWRGRMGVGGGEQVVGT